MNTTLPPALDRQQSALQTRFARWLVRWCWCYLLALLALAAVIRWGCDRTWWGTAVTFAPRWLWAVPAVVLLPLAVWQRGKALRVALVSVWLLLFPVMGFQTGWRGWWPADPGAFQLKVMTCNADSRALNPELLHDYIAEMNPDLVAVQVMSNRHQATVFSPDHWHVFRHNNQVLASRFPILKTVGIEHPSLSSHHGTAAQLLLETPAGKIPFVCLHLATPRRGLLAIRSRLWRGRIEMQANTEHRREQSAAIRALIGDQAAAMIVVGDFNSPAESLIFERDWSDFQNALSIAGMGRGSTHFTQLTDVRIDHVLAGSDWQVLECEVGPAVGSAHRPVFASLAWVGSPAAVRP